MKNYKARLARLHGLRPPPKPRGPLTDERRLELLTELFQQAEASPDDEPLQRRKALILALVARARARKLQQEVAS